MKNFSNGFWVGSLVGMLQVIIVEAVASHGMGWFSCFVTSCIVYLLGKRAAVWAYQPRDSEPAKK